jgi:4-hydroxy-tetrahydrodipicolinate reductase
MIGVAITGSSGRMGRMLIEAVLASTDCRLTGALDQSGSAAIGQDAGAFLGRSTGVAIVADLHQGLAGADVLIDFTRPEGTLAHLAVCGELGVRAVIGTTGFSAEQKAQIAAHAQRSATVLAANMSVGVNVMLKLLAQAARALGEVLARARGVELAAQGVFTRHGHTGERVPGSIGFATVRGGDIVGEHTVLFAGTGERIEISHKSSSRANYADGSLRAARFVASAAPGLYGMDDVLGLG